MYNISYLKHSSLLNLTMNFENSTHICLLKVLQRSNSIYQELQLAKNAWVVVFYYYVILGQFCYSISCLSMRYEPMSLLKENKDNLIISVEIRTLQYNTTVIWTPQGIWVLIFSISALYPFRLANREMYNADREYEPVSHVKIPNDIWY